MDEILYWNEVALDANRASHTGDTGEQRGPVLSARALAIVHLAMYDAYARALQNPTDLPAYLTNLPPAKQGASPEAAVAAAAYGTLLALFPSQKALFDSKLAQAPLSLSGVDEGLEFGRIVAQEILKDRKNDPNAADMGYITPLGRGKHRPDPDNPTQGYGAPFYGDEAKVFAVTTRYSLNAPPQPDTPAYRAALEEVRGKGIAPELMGTLPNNFSPRTPNETLIGIFWAYDGASGLGTPPRLYNQIVKKIAIARNNTPAKNARLFALINVAMADAGILAWADKFKNNLWRPVLGVREHDMSMGTAGIGKNVISNNCDPFWLPLGAPNSNSTKKNFTPNFPAYPSGHATFGAAAFHMTRMFYGVSTGDRNRDDLCDGLTFVSEELDGITQDNKGTVRPRHTRIFPDGLWQAIVENGLSRVYLGVHWIFDAFARDNLGNPDLDSNIGGVRLGIDIAEDIFAGGRANGMRKPL
jgi:membrane-associated phospholipid phosphatase